jgi:hypothetical protein
MKIPRTVLSLFSFIVVTLAQSTPASAADFSAIWDGGNGNWDDPLHWNTNPNYPNNGGFTYDATINSGNVTLNRDIVIQRLFLNGGNLLGAFELTLNEGVNWTGGTIGGPPFGSLATINLGTGSTSTISSPGMPILNVNGTINNSGTVNQTNALYSLGVINNLAGATWNLQGQGQINPFNPFFHIEGAGQFNNAGNLVISGDGSVDPQITTTQIQTSVNNSGNITIQAPTISGSLNRVYISGGSASGSFNLAAQTELALGNYTLTSGTVMNGAGSVDINQTLNVAGDAIVNTNVVNYGTLTVQSGATLTLNGNFNQVTLFDNAITRLSGGILSSSHPLTFQSGVLTGFGTINANVNLTGNSLLTFQLGGTVAGIGANNYDSLSVKGATALGGTLAVRFKNNFEDTISSSDSFSVLTSSSGFSGSFGNAVNGSRMDTADYLGTFVVNYSGSSLSLSNFVPNTRWLGGSGNWTDGTHWLSNPLYPNDNGSTHYSALIRAGTVNLDANINVSRFILTGGSLTGGNTLTVTGGLIWTEGAISGSAGSSINLAAGSNSTIGLPIDGNFNHQTSHSLNGRVLNNFGTVNQQVGISGGVINNMPGATWIGVAGAYQGVFNNFGTVIGPGGTGGVFNNSGSVIVRGDGAFSIGYGGTATGTFEVGSQSELNINNHLSPYIFAAGATVNGAGTTTIRGLTVTGNSAIHTALLNYGTLTVQSGATLTLSGSFKQATYLSDCMTYLNNATLTSAQVLVFEGAILKGSGTINGNITVGSNTDMFFHSVVTPGDQANTIGTFAINGSFSLFNSAKIVMDISGGAAPANDVLTIAGAALLDGILELHVSLTQFNPKQTFTLLTSSDLAGVFDNVANGARLTSADGTTSFQVNYGVGSPYGANNLVLSDPQGVPEPASAILFAGGALALTLFRLRRR